MYVLTGILLIASMVPTVRDQYVCITTTAVRTKSQDERFVDDADIKPRIECFDKEEV